MVGTADWAWPGSQKWRGWLKPGWVRVGRCTCGCRHCSSMENLHGVGPFPQIPGTVQCLGAASGFPHVPGRAVFSLCARVLPGHALEGDAAFYRLPSLDLLWYPQTGGEAGDLVLSCLWHGCRPVAHGFLNSPAPPSAEPHSWHVPFFYPWPNCMSGANASGLRAPGTQL